MLLKTLFVAAVVGSTLAADTPSECQGVYSTALLSANTNDQKCAALASFGLCLDALGDDVDVTTQFAIIENAESVIDCKDYFATVKQARIRNVRDDLIFEVDGTKDAVFQRFKRGTVSVFEMNQQLQDVKATLSTVRDDIKQDAATQADLVASITSKAVLGLTDKVGDLQASVTGVKAEVLAAVDTKQKAFKDQTDALLDGFATDLTNLKAACNSATQYSAGGTCQALKVCDPRTEFEIKAPTKTANRQCKTATVCEAGKTFETDSLVFNANRKCAAVTATCKKGETEIQKPTKTSNRICVITSSTSTGTTLGSSKSKPATSCLAILKAYQFAQSGFYWLAQKGQFDVEEFLCDMSSHGGGWTQVARGIGGHMGNYRATTGDVQPDKLKDFIQTYKKSDKKINALVTERYWMQGSFPPTRGWSDNPNYFWNSTQCEYKHRSTAREQCNCVAESPDMQFQKHCGHEHGGHWGLGDWGGKAGDEPEKTTFDGDRNWGGNDCLHTSHTSNGWYVRRSGTKRCGDGYCYGHQSRCDMSFWVR